MVKIDTGNLVLAVQSISNGRCAVLTCVLQCVFKARPRCGVVAFGIIARVTVYRAFFHSAFCLVPPSLDCHPIRAGFHLVGNAVTQSLFTLCKRRFLFFARLFVFRAVCACVFSFDRFDKLFRVQLHRYFFFALVVCKANRKVVMQTQTQRTFLGVFLYAFVRNVIAEILILAVGHSEKRAFFVLRDF